MFQQRFGVPMQDGYQKAQPDAGRFGMREQFAGGPMGLAQFMATGGNHPAMQAPAFHTGGPGQVQQMPQFTTGGQLPPQQFQPMTGGYNPPQGMNGYPTAGGQLPAYMAQFQPGQSSYGLAGLFRNYGGYGFR